MVRPPCSPSRIGLVSRICCSIQECLPLLAARYWRISLVLSVLPAPDSPLITIHWFCLKNRESSQQNGKLKYQLCSSHHLIAVVPNGEDMRWELSNLLFSVKFDLLGVVDGQDLVGIDCHQYRAGVGLCQENNKNPLCNQCTAQHLRRSYCYCILSTDSGGSRLR